MKNKKDFAVAVSVSRKPKYAKGGQIPSVKEESRPGTQEERNDKKDIEMNSKSSPMPPRPSRVPLKHPSMVKSDAFSVKLRDQEDHLQESAKVNNGPQEEPPQDDNESDPKKRGTSPHKMKMMASGGMVKDSELDETNHVHFGNAGDFDSAKAGPRETKDFNDYVDSRRTMRDKNGNETEDPSQRVFKAKGGMINEEESMHDAEMDDQEDPEGLESDDDMKSPARSKFMAGKMMADGGEVDDEEEMEHDASIAGAIMRKRKYAAGGEVDLDMNAEEEPNHEDDDSYEALQKENYSEEAGLDEAKNPKDSSEHGHEISDEDAHDMVSKIRKLMSKRSPITK